MRRLFILATLGLLVRIAGAGPALLVDRTQVNIRADATVQSERIAVLRMGEVVEQLGTKDEWRQVRLPDGREGWVHSALMQERLVATGKGVRVRAAGSTAAPAVASVTVGDELGKLGQRGNWIEVRLEDGKIGWIWSRYVRPKMIQIPASSTTELELPAEETPAPELPEEMAAEQPVVEEPSLVDETVEDVEEEEPPRVVLENPYAEGLQKAIEGNFPEALTHFERVLEEDPANVNALVHAARAHRQLGEYARAQEKLYRAIDLGTGRRDIFKELAEVYRFAGQLDSAAKYQAQFTGEEWQPAAAAEEVVPVVDETRPLVEVLWIYAGIVGGTSLLLAMLIYMLRRQKKGSGEEKPQKREKPGKFARTMSRSEERGIQVDSGEEAELNRQIEEKKNELRASSAAFWGTEVAGVGEGLEDQNLEQILNQLEALRSALAMQDERAQIYADIVRLQNMQIAEMDQQLQMLRRRNRG